MNRGIKNRRRNAGLALAVCVLGFTACDIDELLEVEDRDVVSPATLDDPEVLPVVIAGALGDFTDAFDGGEAYISVSALITDEFHQSDTFTTRTATDRRDQFTPDNGNTSDGTYVSLQFARRALKDATAQVAEVRSTADADYQQLKALEGYTMILLTEGFCSPIPLSNVVDGEFVYGVPVTGAALLDSAIVRFDASLAGGANDLAAVGKGRALLDLGAYAEAAAAVAGVSTDWEYRIFHSESGTNNSIFGLQSNGRYSQSDLEGSNETGLPFRDPEDPRAPWTLDGVGFDDTTPLYVSNKYNDYSDPTILASGVEARLIEAEAALQASNYIGMTVILNDLRSQVGDIMADWVPNYAAYVAAPVLAPLPPPANAADARDMLFSERAFWLYLTGHRLGDARRLIYQYGVAADEAFPSGVFHKGGTYGPDVAFPLDFDEANNENYSHDMCNVESAAIS